jgi:hypothetical protein
MPSLPLSIDIVECRQWGTGSVNQGEWQGLLSLARSLIVAGHRLAQGQQKGLLPLITVGRWSDI